jgi:cytoskeletal protein RodZ
VRDAFDFSRSNVRIGVVMNIHEGDTPANTQSTMAERRIAFGRQLADLRSRSGMSLDSLAQATRISRNFIAALEAGKFEQLPGDVFARGFVKSLTRTMGADGDEMVRLFTAALTPDPPLAKTSKSPIVRGRQIKTALVNRAPKSDVLNPTIVSSTVASQPLGSAERSDADAAELHTSQDVRVGFKSNPVVIATVTGTVLLLTALTWLLLSQQRRDDAPLSTSLADPPQELANSGNLSTDSTLADVELSDPAQDLGVDEDLPGAVLSDPPVVATDSVAEPVVEPIKDAAASTSAAVSFEAPAQAEEVAAATPEVAPVEAPANISPVSGARSVQVLVKAPVTIRVTIDQKPMETRELKPDSYSIDFEEKAELLILDASAVEITFNGRSLGSLGAKGRVRRLSFAAEPPTTNAARSDVGETPKSL